jgi:dTDP-4-dehydrorhamnose reductase
VGRALLHLLGSEGVGFNSQQLDFRLFDHLEADLTRLCPEPPKAIINAAAYTQVDQAEQDNSINLAVNAYAPGILADWCAKREIPLIHYSTDYVFPGTGFLPWREDDIPKPINAYGAAKLLGEASVLQRAPKSLIFRTSWVYDAYGKNFFRTMLRLGEKMSEISIVFDQVGAPTYAPHLAAATLRALDRALDLPEFPSGVYHLCNSGETSWYEFAQAIFHRAKIPLKVRPIKSAEFPTRAQRPKNSKLNTEKVFKTLGVKLPPWKRGLDDCWEEYESHLS